MLLLQAEELASTGICGVKLFPGVVKAVGEVEGTVQSQDEIDELTCCLSHGSFAFLGRILGEKQYEGE